jgi:hypothetical protein
MANARLCLKLEPFSANVLSSSQTATNVTNPSLRRGSSVIYFTLLYVKFMVCGGSPTRALELGYEVEVG